MHQSMHSLALARKGIESHCYSPIYLPQLLSRSSDDVRNMLIRYQKFDEFASFHMGMHCSFSPAPGFDY